MSTIPTPLPYTDGEMPDSIRIACASNSGDLLNGHFGSCERFLVYQVSQTAQRLIDVREIGDDEAAEDKNAYRADLIKDCQVLFIASVGGPAAAKIIKKGIHPIKQPTVVPCSELLDKLQLALANPSPWLGKVMGKDAQARARFTGDDEDDELLEAEG
ncbi:MAG: NifB/NifX family molybdenum-iron cluster-binding protein [Thiothrix sp.]|uniref:NifB/NifX family molybdenum-iron cluster-binding protein n=1 Tax=Thiothrix sp. TaxID=1032 RepID=UPI00262BDE07|nr:NifB/NifX family molybdenum-iron cluster-binding protein [Thiothrix sp.]MDD5394358.1 NifB/NifX family molybdenum-iron cluster-binding protein [Thiothrix sp.]